MTTVDRALRLFLLMAIVAALTVAIAEPAKAQNNDRGTAGMNQGRNCAGQGGHATVYIEGQGDGSNVSYVWCEFSDGSGWTCSNTDYGTDCSTWSRVASGPRATPVDRATTSSAKDTSSAHPTPPTTSRGHVAKSEAVDEMTPLEEKP